MKDNSCVAFLQWALPKLKMRWKGFRKVRRQVCKRIDRRIDELGLAGIDSYKRFLGHHKEEWQVLDHFCRITISRFYRDRLVYDILSTEVLPALAQEVMKRNDPVLRVWSAGCASGEEPYTMALIYHYILQHRFPDMQLEVIATDIDSVVLERARQADYPKTSIRELPAVWQEDAFVRQKENYRLKESIKDHVRFCNLDIRKETPSCHFHMILCRNLAFTYFDRKLQGSVLEKFKSKLEVGGILVIGIHEQLPNNGVGFNRWIDNVPIYQRTDA